MPWKSLNISIGNIRTETQRAVLISCPHSSRYDGYVFWHPAKLVRAGRNRAAVSMSYTEDFTFGLIKYGAGRFNGNEVISEKAVPAAEIEEMFAPCDAASIEPKSKAQAFPELEAERGEAIEELLDTN